MPDLLPVADGHREYWDYCCYCCSCGLHCVEWCCESGDYINGGILAGYDYFPAGNTNYYGILEFDLANLTTQFSSGQIKASLSLTVLDRRDLSNICVGVYDIEDTSENGMIETVDTPSGDHLGEICGNFQLGEILTFNVTSAVEHDLFDSGQTHFSGFVITGGN